MSIKERAYYLWEDDKKEGRKLLSENEYWLLANNIASKLYCYQTFVDITDSSKYEECNICMEYTAKIECKQCTQIICGRCIIKVKKCPYCNYQPIEEKKSNNRITYTRDQLRSMQYMNRQERAASHQQPDFGRRVTFTIPRRGDLLTDPIVIQLPSINQEALERGERRLSHIDQRFEQRPNNYNIPSYYDEDF